MIVSFQKLDGKMLDCTIMKVHLPPEAEIIPGKLFTLETEVEGGRILPIHIRFSNIDGCFLHKLLKICFGEQEQYNLLQLEGKRVSFRFESKDGKYTAKEVAVANH
jgi:hypothetical protein